MNEIRTWRLLLATLLLSICQLVGLQVQAQPSVGALQPPGYVEVGDLEHTLLREPAAFFKADRLTPFEEVLHRTFTPLTQSDLNQGISGDVFWVRLALRNSADVPRRWVLHNDSTYLDNLNVYYRHRSSDGFSLQELSDRRPFDSRPLSYRRLAFSEVTEPGAITELYLQISYDKPDSVSLNFSLWEAGAFQAQVQREQLFYGAYYGALLTLSLITLVLTIVLRQRIYLYYGAFLLSTAFMWALLNGLGFQYLWPGSIYIQNEGFHIAYLLFTLSAFQFSKAFLQTAQIFPRIHRLISLWQIFLLAGIGLRALGAYAGVLDIAFAGLLSLVALPVLGWLASARGVKQASWYSLAWLVYALTLVLSVLSAYTSLFSWGMDPLVLTQLGSLVESCLLSIAIGSRLLHLDRDRRLALELAHQDPLTGIGNRRRLVDHYEQVRSRFLVGNMPVYVILIDMDHFKRINDTYGHDAGDKVLQELARLLLTFTRDDDACIRYGGDEFLMVVRVKDLEGAYQIAERIRNHFSDKPTVFDERMIRHTLSVGVIPAITQTVSLSTGEMLATVDHALYQAKTGGRNQTVMFRTSLSAEDPV